MQKIIASEKDMLVFGGALAKAIIASHDGARIHLHGLLGAGKTTFVRGFLQDAGFDGKVKSPTYTLVEPYHVVGKNIFHFDLYRIEDPDELIYLGIEDYFTHDAICLIEWPERGLGILTNPDLLYEIEFEKEHKRKINVKAQTSRGEHILHVLKENIEEGT